MNYRCYCSLIKNIKEGRILTEEEFDHINNKEDIEKRYELIEKIISRFNFNLLRKEQKVVLNIPGTCIIYADEHLITSVIENIISNASKFSDHGKNIFVSIHEIENNFVLSIKDEGPGFSPEDLDSAFKKFKQLSSKPTGGESSTGLGLYIVKRIVDLHGGTIEIKSEGKNKGAEFIIALPKK